MDINKQEEREQLLTVISQKIQTLLKENNIAGVFLLHTPGCVIKGGSFNTSYSDIFVHSDDFSALQKKISIGIKTCSSSPLSRDKKVALAIASIDLISSLAASTQILTRQLAEIKKAASEYWRLPEDLIKVSEVKPVNNTNKN